MELLVDIKLPKQRLVGGRVPHKGCKPTMLDLNNYGFISLNDKSTTETEDLCLNAYEHECFEYVHFWN